MLLYFYKKVSPLKYLSTSEEDEIVEDNSTGKEAPSHSDKGVESK